MAEAGGAVAIQTMPESEEASAEDKAMLEDLITKIQRDVNCLADKSKMTRKRSLNKLKGVVLEDKPPPYVQGGLFAIVLKPLLKLFVDPVEKIREIAIQFMVDLVPVCPYTFEALPYMMPIIVNRLGGPDFEEDSEEVRLLLVELIHLVAEAFPEGLMLFMDDYIQILQRTIVDKFADVIKRSARCIRTFSKVCERRFITASKPLHKPLARALLHQHSRVRVEVIKAIEAICLYGENTAINDFMLPLAQSSMDHAPTVRKALYEAVGSWMLDLKDRYSFWHKLLTLMLNGANDEIPELQVLCTKLFHLAGAKWEKENEDDLKDFLDFGNTGNGRLPLGCRILVDREIGKILPGLLKDLCDWTSKIRLQSAKLLLTLLRYAESKATMHLEVILQGYFKSVRDEEQAISDLVVQCVEVTGQYTVPADWKQHMLPRLIAKGVSSSEQIAQLIVLGGLLRGGDPERLEEHLLDICQALADEDVCAAPNPELLDELLLLIGDIIEIAGPNCSMELSELMFVAMINGRATSEHVDGEFNATLARVAEAQGKTVVDVYAAHTPHLLRMLKETHASWTKHSHHRQLFNTVLERAGPVLGQEIEIVMEIFYTNFHVDKDPEVRLSFFALLSRLLSQASGSLNSTGDFKMCQRVIKDILIPNCIWVNGRVPAAIRTAAITCTWALFQSKLVLEADLAATIAALLPQLVVCLDDEYEATRGVACLVIERLLVIYTDGFTRDYAAYDRLHTLYPELLKRLDDNSDSIRLSVLKSWMAYAKCMTSKPYDRGLYKAHLEVMFKGLLIHLDDPDEAIQKAVEAVLREMAPLEPEVLASYAKAAKGKHRDAARCEQVQICAEKAHRLGASSGGGGGGGGGEDEEVEKISTGETGGGNDDEIPEVIQRDAAGRPKEGKWESIAGGGETAAATE